MQNGTYTEKADVYSFGVILYEMLTRNQFFEEERFFSRMEQKIIAGERPELPHCYPEIESLVRSCWDGDASRRPSFADIIGQIKDIMRFMVLLVLPVLVLMIFPTPTVYHAPHRLYCPKEANYDQKHADFLSASAQVDWQLLMDLMDKPISDRQ